MAHPTPADHGQVVMRLEGIGKDYGDSTVLDGVSLDLRAGEVLALTGENGAGKSTCSKIMCGLVQASRGQMTLMGKPLHPCHVRTQSVRACAWCCRSWGW